MESNASLLNKLSLSGHGHGHGHGHSHGHGQCCDHEHEPDVDIEPYISSNKFADKSKFKIEFINNEYVELDGIKYVKYKDETQMPMIIDLITRDLSEPYSVYTYRYFIHNWPHLCFLVNLNISKEICAIELSLGYGK